MERIINWGKWNEQENIKSKKAEIKLNKDQIKFFSELYFYYLRSHPDIADLAQEIIAELKQQTKDLENELRGKAGAGSKANKITLTWN
jgi:hypothetical protein